MLATAHPVLDITVVGAEVGAGGDTRGGWRILVAGELDVASGDELVEVAESLASVRSEGAEIDLSRVTFADTAGWRAVQAARQRMFDASGTSRVIATSEAVDRLVAGWDLARLSATDE